MPPGDSLRVDDNLNLRLSIGVASLPQALVAQGTPLADAMARIESDPISLEIMWSRLVTVVDEMWLTVIRTAFSLIISEAQDFACELLDANGEPLVHSPRAMPVFNLCLPRAVKALLAKFPPETLVPGDVLVTNDPWLCAGHLFDIAVLTPVFRDGRLVGLVGTVGHVSDIGGTKESLKAREIFEEGIQIPPMKLFRAGVANEDLFTLLAENVRNPAQVLGDIHSFVSANAVGAERLTAFMSEYGIHDLEALAAVLQGRSEKAMREAIVAMPDGVYTSEVWNNPLGTPLRYPVKLTVKGDTIEVDFEGAPPQLPQGGLNCTLNYSASHATYPLKCMLTPNVRGNAGCYRAFTVKAPEGSALNCDKPMSVNLRTRTGWYIAPNIFTALAKAAPGRVQAATGLPVAIAIYGRDAAGQIYSDHLFMGGGQGGSEAGDGVSALLVADLGGQYLDRAAGAARAGSGHREGLCAGLRAAPAAIVADSASASACASSTADGLPTLSSVYPEGVGIEVPGLFGGKPGRSARGVVRDASGAIIQDCGTGRAGLHDHRSGDRRGLPLRRLGLRLAVRAAAGGDRARSRRRLHHAGGRRAGLRRRHRTAMANWTWRKAPGAARPARRRSDGLMRRPPVSPIAWAIAPAALLFVLFFILPFGVMAMLSLLSGNPVSNPNVTFTLAPLHPPVRQRPLFRRAGRDLAHRRDHDRHRAADRLSARALDGADALASRPRAAADGGDRAAAHRHRRAHLRLDDDARPIAASSTPRRSGWARPTSRCR